MEEIPMQTIPVSLLQPVPRVRPRTALVTSADGSFRDRLAKTLIGLRWQVREAESGAQAWSEAEAAPPEAVILDSWLPDLDLAEFVSDFRGRFPQTDLITTGGSENKETIRGPHRQELLYAVRRSQDTDTAAWNIAPALTSSAGLPSTIGPKSEPAAARTFPFANGAGPREASALPAPAQSSIAKTLSFRTGLHPEGEQKAIDRLPELIGDAPCMLEVSRRIRLVAQRMTPVLIEGPTGSGKELVAEALHRLSSRSRKPFVAINCAAIPEALLEAELFGHTRGAFTGAVQGRVGRIESADGGTLFLDEIGEMPLALQSKLLRFIESSELQRVGDNETVKVDVRILAATHQPLADHAKAGSFRADLYYRLAVFLIRTPSLIEHAQDLSLLVDHFLQKMGREEPMKRIDQGAMAKLAAHDWPGNVRELEHVLERAAILAGDEPLMTMREIDFGFSVA
jgi:DNA-binding NtrC family response regulator